MLRHALAAIMILALTLAMAGRTEVAAAAQSLPLQSPLTQSIAFQDAVAGKNAEVAPIVRSVSAKAGCNGYPHLANGTCSFDALPVGAETVVPSYGFHAVTWSAGSEHLNRIFLDPDSRPPIPVS